MESFSSKLKKDKNVIFLFRLIIAVGIILIFLTSLLLYAYLTILNKECGTNAVVVEDFKLEQNDQNLPNESAATKTVMRKLKMVNEDDHPIVFDMCQKDICRGERLIAPNESYEIEFPSKFTTVWKCKAWFNDIDKDPMNFTVWKGTENAKNIKYMVRKNDGIYKSDYDGSNEKVHFKFA